LALAEVMKGAEPASWDWSRLEHWLANATNDGCHLVVRPLLDFPDQPSGIPDWCKNPPFSLPAVRYASSSGKGFCPDYRAAGWAPLLTRFIAEFGRRYDGDPRIGFLEAGLLGHWGEWHCDGPVAELWPPLPLQRSVLGAYVRAFPRTRLLVRYPAGSADLWGGFHPMARNDTLPVGYHDDSFCMDTVGTPAGGYFVPGMSVPGCSAAFKWRQYPIGGQFRPTTEPVVWTAAPGSSPFFATPFATAVQASHATYILNPQTFRREFGPSSPGYGAALAGTAMLGYDFFVASCTLGRDDRGVRAVTITVTNQGVAPFYGGADWPVELAACKSTRVVKRWRPGWLLGGIQPGASVALAAFSLGDPPPGAFSLIMRVVNPLPNGRPLRFANATQDEKLDGWLTLGTVEP